MKILIVEDEPEMLQNIQFQLEKENYTVETAGTYDEGLEKLAIYDYDCILLDITLPDGDGLDLLEFHRKSEKNSAVIILSAKNSLDDKLSGLNLGADDYLPKPFHFAELNARINAVLRRRSFDGNDFIEIENVSIDPRQRTLHINGKEVILNRKEFDIFLYLCVNRNRLIRKSALAEHVWGDHIDQSDDYSFIYAQIKNLRKKLIDNGAELELKAIYGIGYKIITE
ncbi:response regulator transcription factor [Antarcticibacterium sp. 1MA-6-2]|uniref:response regulator transcription factor n=1 Tax=Antarcticibacterium sp. 1MA-6-2 TaxID=2908210 RepID=UPI001F2C0F67|nr:response regulator transcription factor [Antarcticibacterium sp. 1MA-6-2]UJH92626.1 response regulator transcription factor [Antarcticibacterium sp. 1MA-6-2]